MEGEIMYSNYINLPPLSWERGTEEERLIIQVP
jgi:hypothetical protein